MEAIATLSLLCNVIQVVSFGHETISFCKQIYDKGPTTANNDTNKNSRHLSKIVQELDDSINNALIHRSLAPAQKELQNLAKQCSKIAADLQKELDRLERSSNGGRRMVFGKAIKSILRKGTIEDLEKRLKDCQSILDTRLLTNLSTRQEALTVRSEEIFDTLDGNLKVMINQLVAGHTKLSDLVVREGDLTRSVVREEATTTRTLIDTKFQGLRLTDGHQERYARFVGSLKYPEMNQRRSDVTDSHVETLEWIFDGTEDIRWSSFPKWLEASHDQKIYWVSGKAGSGKSTLMKFVIQDERTQEIMDNRQWPNQAIILTYFFWTSGTPVQRSLKGLYCSLLYQLLDNQHGLFESLERESNISRQRKIYSKETNGDWSNKELVELLLQTVNLSQKSIYFFIDGLDELDQRENLQDLLAFIRNLSAVKDVKICVSSRPELAFQDSFQGCPNLWLQDLTAKDIEKFVTDKLQDAPQLSHLIPSPAQISELIELVLDKAEGVFLWVSLALNSLLRGMTNRDNWDTLQKRLDALPAGMMELYQLMWKRLNEDEPLYRREAARYLRYCVYSLEREADLSIFKLMVATDVSLQKKLLIDELGVPSRQLVEKCQQTETNLYSRCVGLLEVFDLRIVEESDGSEDALSEFHHLKGVRFIHRSAMEFLMNTEAGKEILSHHIATELELDLARLRRNLVVILIIGTKRKYMDVSGPRDMFLHILGYLQIRCEMQPSAEAREEWDKLFWITWRTHQRIGSPKFDQVGHMDLRKYRKIPDTVTDFVGLAAQWGCERIVRQILEPAMSSTGFNIEYMSYVLSCAVSPSYGEDLSSNLDLICWLLDQGADIEYRYCMSGDFFRFGCFETFLINTVKTFGHWNSSIHNRALFVDRALGIIRRFSERRTYLLATCLIGFHIGSSYIEVLDLSHENWNIDTNDIVLVSLSISDLVDFVCKFLGDQRGVFDTVSVQKPQKIMLAGKPKQKIFRVTREDDSQYLLKTIGDLLTDKVLGNEELRSSHETFHERFDEIKNRNEHVEWEEVLKDEGVYSDNVNTWPIEMFTNEDEASASAFPLEVTAVPGNGMESVSE